MSMLMNTFAITLDKLFESRVSLENLRRGLGKSITELSPSSAEGFSTYQISGLGRQNS